MKWDSKAKERLLELRKQGWSLARLARFFDVSRMRIWQLFNDYKGQNVPPKSKSASMNNNYFPHPHDR